MFGIVLAAAGNLFQEISHSIGKKEMRDGAASPYTIGFLISLSGVIFFIVSGLVRDHFIFSLASLPTFLPRVALELVQAHVTVRAIAIADRGDFGFVRTLTIPLLLAVDIALGYAIGPLQMAGMALIVLSVPALVLAERGRIPGLLYLAIATVNAAATISLYKYDISHFNSVEAEQGLIGIALIVYFFTLAYFAAGENPLRFLTRRVFLAQSVAGGLADVAYSFAYLYGPASVILAALRSFAVLFAVLSGRVYFREQRFILKLLLFAGIGGGLALLSMAM